VLPARGEQTKEEVEPLPVDFTADTVKPQKANYSQYRSTIVQSIERSPYELPLYLYMLT